MVIKLAKYIVPFFIIFGNHNLFSSEINSPTKNIDFNINHAEVISGFPIEGNLVIAKTKPENKVLFNNQKIQIDDSGIFIFGFHRDEESSSKLVIINSENDQFETIIQPIKREYKIQRINGLKQSMVSPPKELIKKIKSDTKKVKLARSSSAVIGDFTKGFDWPVKGTITGVYGSQRILNDVPKSPHFGIDISVPNGTKVIAPASGTVTLTEDLYYSGLTVILNHGLNLNSTFLHLSEINVKLGDRVNRGGLIGLSGNTGRSTGPHLDWRMDWNGKRLDPEMLAGPMKQ